MTDHSRGLGEPGWLLHTFARAAAPATQPLQPLSPREEEVLRTVARGLTNAEIADQMHLSFSTVRRTSRAS